MTVLNSEKLIKHIQHWLDDYIKENHKKNLIIFDDNSPGALFTIHICNQITRARTLVENPHPGELAWEPSERLIETADSKNGLIVGTLTRNEGHLLRKYHKYGKGACDIFPIADLYHSEIVDILDFLNIPNIFDEKIDEILTYSDVEWADRENERSGIIEKDEDPKNKSSGWFRFTLKQKEIISRLHQIEKRTRHKRITAPICKVRDLGFIR